MRNFPNLGPSKFTFKLNPELEKDEVNIARDDMVQNYTKATTQAMDKGTPWRGAREKSPRFMKMFIEASSTLGDMVVDYSASTSKLHNYSYTLQELFSNLFYLLPFYSNSNSLYMIQVVLSTLVGFLTDTLLL